MHHLTRDFPQPLDQPIYEPAGRGLSTEPTLEAGWDGVNPYYPSPEMHADAFDSLIEPCSRYADPPGLEGRPGPEIRLPDRAD